MPILLLLTLLACLAYTCWRFWLILPLHRSGKWIAVGLYVFCFGLFLVRTRLDERMSMPLATAAYEIGCTWTVFFVYALLLFLLLDLGRLLHLVPEHFLRDSLAGSLTVLGLLGALLAGGGIHYHHKYREELDIRTEKPLERPLTIVLASDLHIGYHNRPAEVSRWADLIRAEQPDLVLLAGDVLDGSLRPVREGGFDGIFRRMGAPVWAVPGNHEYYAGLPGAEEFFAREGITLLRDDVAEVLGIRIVGRDDRSRRERASLQDLAPAEAQRFTLLLDHQPFHLEEAEQAGIDFQFSGHTHYGQFWPASWITDLIYEKAYGSHRRGATRYYVSSGLGIWGPKVRIGTRSEYVVLHLHN